MNAILARDAVSLPLWTNSAAVPATIARAMTMPDVEIMNIFRLPIMSWKRVPTVEKIQPTSA